MSPGHVLSNTVGADPHVDSQSHGGSSDITKGHSRVMGRERSWQCKSMFAADKPLGDTDAVIWVAFNDSFSFWPWICQGLTAPLSQTALCHLPLASCAALLYHSVPK